MGRRWAWPNDTTPNTVPLECIARWLWTSAGVTTKRAQHWLEPYAQCLELGQWHSQTALEAHALVVAKQVQPRNVSPGWGTGAAVPRPSATLSSMAPILGAVTFLPVPNLGIGTLPRMTMSSWKCHHGASGIVGPCYCNGVFDIVSTQYLDGAFGIIGICYCNGTSRIVSKHCRNGALGIIGECGHNSASGIIGKCGQNSASGIISKRIDVDATNTSTLTITEADEKATAEIYS